MGQDTGSGQGASCRRSFVLRPEGPGGIAETELGGVGSSDVSTLSWGQWVPGLSGVCECHGVTGRRAWRGPCRDTRCHARESLTGECVFMDHHSEPTAKERLEVGQVSAKTS